MNNQQLDWEILFNDDIEYTAKLKVEGGSLYRTVIKDSNNTLNTSMCFVPDVDLQRYQAHLRDAYKKGYSDGQADSRVGISAPPE